MPLDATCAFTAAGLSRAVADAADAHRRRLAAAGTAAEGPQAAANQSLQPFTYAVLYHSRDTAEAPAAAQQPASMAAAATTAGPAAGAAAEEAGVSGGGDGTGVEGGGESEVLADRGRIIQCVAAAMRAAFGEAASVNLKKPDVSWWAA